METKQQKKLVQQYIYQTKTDFKTNTITREKHPATQLLGIHLNKHKTVNKEDIYIHMFIVALFIHNIQGIEAN